jgi:hypothetical protein
MPNRNVRAPTRSVGRAGSTRRVTTTSRSRSQSVAQINGELVQRRITFLSGETCQTACEPSFAPASKACLNTRNALAKASVGAAEVSRGHSTDPRRPIETGRTER